MFKGFGLLVFEFFDGLAFGHVTPVQGLGDSQLANDQTGLLWPHAGFGAQSLVSRIDAGSGFRV